MSDTATPRPWEIFRYENGAGRLYVDRTLIADLYNEGDREFLLEAVNAYDRLRAIETAARALDNVATWTALGRPDEVAALRKALETP
jgi:hypothetical protein